MMRRQAALRRRQTHRKPARQGRSFVPILESLEDRNVLSTVHALFDLAGPETSPFPSNWFTVADNTQNTGRRVNLPLPDPVTHQSDYEDVQVINELDGFNTQPRLSIPFDGPINVNTITSKTVFQISLGDTLPGGDKGGEVIGINQIVWDPASNTLHAQSDELLDQHTRYALIVTQGIQDLSGHHVKASQEFKHFVHHGQGEYHTAIVQAIEAAEEHGVPEHNIVAASVFSTESATAILEKIRDQIHAATPGATDFNVGSNGERTVFNLDDVKGITFNEQTGADPIHFTPVQLNVGLLHIIPGAVGTIAFGKYVSPDYEVHPGEYIPSVGTLTGTPVVQGMNEVYFNLFLPSGPKPDGGWPVAIFGHGGGTDKNVFGTYVAASMAAQGIATIGIESVGNGFGPLGTLAVSQTDGSQVTLPAGGRSFDQDGNGDITSLEGFFAAEPRRILWWRDSMRQTAADLMQLVRVIQLGIRVTGDATPDLDPSRIYYFGQSQGGSLGPILMAVEPDVTAGVFSSGFGSFIDTNRLSASLRHPRIESYLQARMPSLLNSPGITEIDSVPVGAPGFNENLPLRNGIPLQVHLADGTDQTIQSPVTNTVAGAMDIQKVMDDAGWVMRSGDSLGYAPHLRKAPLPGVPAKSVIVMFAKGDQGAPNPMETALVRAGDLADRTTFFRNDLAHADHPELPDPHQFMSNVYTNPAATAIALEAQRQIATFFASNGTETIQPEPKQYFEVPIKGPLPEDLNWIVDNGPRGAAAPLLSSDAHGPTVTDSAGGSPSMPNLFPPVQRGEPAVGLGSFFATPWTSQPVATLPADGVHDGFGQALDGAGTGVAGSDHTDAFFRLFGDGDGDGHVGLNDLRRFVSTLGKRAGDPGFLWYFDYDGDGRVDRGDLFQFLRRFGR
jgi:hypothetical protein